MLQISHLYKKLRKISGGQGSEPACAQRGSVWLCGIKRSRKDNNDPDGMRTYAADRGNHYDPWRGCPAASEGDQKADRLCAGFFWCV